MATHQLSQPEINVPDKRRTASVPNAAASTGTPANYASNASLDTRLAAISGTTFTQARLDQMNQNDKVYALRTLDDPTSI